MKYQNSKSNAYKPLNQPAQKTKTLIIKAYTRNTRLGFVRYIKDTLKVSAVYAERIFDENLHLFSVIKIGLTNTHAYWAKNEIKIETNE